MKNKMKNWIKEIMKNLRNGMSIVFPITKQVCSTNGIGTRGATAKIKSGSNDNSCVHLLIFA
jgi:hypothetical protein